MSRPGITYDDVAHAAQQLAAQGKIPTIEMIRLLTGTGSNTTIAQHLKIWKNRQTQAKSFNTNGKLPEEIAVVVKGLWDGMVNQADEKVTEIKQELEQAMALLQEQNKKLQEDNTHWQQQYHQVQQQKEGLASDKAALEQIIRKFENEKTALMAENNSMTQQLQDKQAHLEELRRLNKQVQANLEHYYEASREQRLRDQHLYEQIQTQSTQTINQLKQELTALNQQKNSLQKEWDQLHHSKMILQDQHDQLSIQHETMKSSLDKAQKELLQQTEARQHWQNQSQITQEKLDEQNTALANLQSQLAVLNQKFSGAEDKMKEVSEQNKFLTHERWVLGQEKAQLLGQLKQLEKLNHSQLKAEQ